MTKNTTKRAMWTAALLGLAACQAGGAASGVGGGGKADEGSADGISQADCLFGELDEKDTVDLFDVHSQAIYVDADDAAVDVQAHIAAVASALEGTDVSIDDVFERYEVVTFERFAADDGREFTMIALSADPRLRGAIVREDTTDIVLEFDEDGIDFGSCGEAK